MKTVTRIVILATIILLSYNWMCSPGKESCQAHLCSTELPIPRDEATDGGSSETVNATVEAIYAHLCISTGKGEYDSKENEMRFTG